VISYWIQGELIDSDGAWAINGVGVMTEIPLQNQWVGTIGPLDDIHWTMQMNWDVDNDEIIIFGVPWRGNGPLPGRQRVIRHKRPVFINSTPKADAWQQSPEKIVRAHVLL